MVIKKIATVPIRPEKAVQPLSFLFRKGVPPG